MQDLKRTFSLHHSSSSNLFKITQCGHLPLVVRMTGLLVVVIKVLMAAKKPTSSSNMTSTCGSRKQINPDQTWITCGLISIKLQVQEYQVAKGFTSSNRMSDVAVFLLCGTVWSQPGDGLPTFLVFSFSDDVGPPKCKWSALAWILK